MTEQEAKHIAEQLLADYDSDMRPDCSCAQSQRLQEAVARALDQAWHNGYNLAQRRAVDNRDKWFQGA